MVAKTKCKVILETDAHSANTMSKKVTDLAIDLIHKWKLEANLIEQLVIR
jgi:hypothetical protein